MNVANAARRGAQLAWALMTSRAVPFHVTLSVTSRCNARCVYCSLPDLDEEELPAGAWRAILAELKRLGTARVLFFGGEPLLRDDLAGIVAEARRLGLRRAMTTNGILVPERRDVVGQLNTINVSLDGAPEAHDRNRGRGSHARALAAVAAARS
jgi:MoaA/NifB/PqqE/SkfB family radical SAM enzyme